MDIFPQVWERVIDVTAGFLIGLGLFQPSLALIPPSLTATTTQSASTTPEVVVQTVPVPIKKETHSEIDTETSSEFNILRETNSMTLSTPNWERYHIVSYASDYGFIIHIPKEWQFNGSGFSLEGKKIAERPPGILRLHEGQSCLDSYEESTSFWGSEGGETDVLKKKRIILDGREFVWAQTKSNWHTGVANTYCVQEEDSAFIISFYIDDADQDLLREVVSSVRITH